MKVLFAPGWSGAAGLLAMLSIVGCTPTPLQPVSQPEKPAAVDHGHDHDHEHHDHAHPGTLAEGVAELGKAVAALGGHLAADSRDAADDAVHSLGHLLEDLQGQVNTSELEADAKAAATTALDELFECFGKLDEALHAAPGTGDSPAEVHASVAQRVAEAVAALGTAVQANAAAVGDEAAAIIEDAKHKENR